MEKKSVKSKKEIMSIFNLNAPDPTGDKIIDLIPYHPSISQFLSIEDFTSLKNRIKSTKKQNIHNILNKQNEKQKVIRIKEESSHYIQELHDQLVLLGIPIKLSVLVEFLLLKSMNKL